MTIPHGMENNMANNIVSVKPEFGVNYNNGFMGFSFTDNSFVSNGIAWFDRWEKGKHSNLPDLNLSHTFIVSGKNECIEAIDTGVSLSPLSKFFDDPHTHVCFRKPLGLTDAIATRMLLDASKLLGSPYDFVLIAGHAISDTFGGKLLDEITKGKSRDLITWLFETKGRYICSELCAEVLRKRPEYANKGVLTHPPYSLDPQILFQDEIIFSPWFQEIKGQKV